jgi:hypothetical protein
LISLKKYATLFAGSNADYYLTIKLPLASSNKNAELRIISSLVKTRRELETGRFLQSNDGQFTDSSITLDTNSSRVLSIVGAVLAMLLKQFF